MKEFHPRSLEQLAETWPSEIDHISATSLKMFARCPEQWRTRYLLGLRVPPGGAMIQGRADHAAIGANFEHKLREGGDMSIDEVSAEFVTSFEAEVEKEGGVAEVNWGKDLSPVGKRKVAAETKDAGVTLVQTYWREVAPFVWPLEIEEPFEIAAGALPVKLVGRIDLVASDIHGLTVEPLLDTEKIIERKTSKSSRPQADWALQAGIYQLVRPLPVDFHMSLKHRSPRVEWGTPELRVPCDPGSVGRTQALVGQMVRMLGSFYQAYGPDHPWPGLGTLHPWACGFCGYEPGCSWRH